MGKRLSKAELQAIYLRWCREEAESIELLEAVAAFLGNPEKRALKSGAPDA